MMLAGAPLAGVPLAGCDFLLSQALILPARFAVMPVDASIATPRGFGRFPLPQPIPLGLMGYLDSDGPWQIDCTANMTQRNTTIASIGTTIVQRVDQTTIGAADIVASDGVSDPSGLKFTFNVTARGLSAQYLLGFPLSLANGDRITRWGILTTIPNPG